MDISLVPEVALWAVDAEVRRLIPTLDPPLAPDPDDATYGAALRHYLLFAHWPMLLARHGYAPDPVVVAYNAYYWFLTFKRLWQARHGPDAGMDQQWFGVDRHTGKPLWERAYFRPNCIVGVADGVVVASETRSDGPWTFDFGCYGISLRTGRLLWTSHRDGWWGRVVRLFDYVPGFTNELRDVPARVTAGGEVVCGSGRVLDVRTGRRVRRVSPDEVGRARDDRPKTDAALLYDSGMVVGSTGVALSPGRRLSVKPAVGPSPPGFHLYLSDDRGTPVWAFDLAAATGYEVTHPNHYSYRLAGPHVYVVASEEPKWRPHPTKAHHIVPNRRRFHLLAVELGGGTVVQNVRLTDAPVAECRIEDVDERAVLVSIGTRKLRCYGRVH